jgi:translation initiation factor IF-3
MDIKEALRTAEDQTLDLVEIAPDATPPVCKIMDYGKFLYAEEKKLKESKKKQHHTKVKEVRLGPQMGEHDYLTKVNQAREFLSKHDKVKITMRFKGREMDHIDLGRKLMDRCLAEVSDVAVIEQKPRMEGRIMNFLLSPK